jgi:hydroxypyruvate reductase
MVVLPESMNRKLTRDALAIWNAGVEAVKSDRIVSTQFEWDGRWLCLEDQVWDFSNIHRVVVVGAGKATAGMLAGLVEVFQRSPFRTPELVGWVNVPEGVGFADESWPTGITVSQARPAGCNEPTEKVVEGTKRILDLMRRSGRNDCAIALISGGGSALLCAPIDAVSLVDKVAITRDLAAAGANIEQLNTVRRCLSQVKGGGLARACQARYLITCVLSDVLGDPLHIIASGPTIRSPDPSPTDAIAVLQTLLPGRYQAILRILEAQRSALENGRQRTPRASAVSPDHEYLAVLGNNATAVDAAGQKAVELGYRYWMQSATSSEGDAGQVGQSLASQLILSAAGSQVNCIISGGEPTVRLPDSAIRGKGGRNQQLVLSALMELRSRCSLGNLDFAFLSGGTDGEDGPTDAAGAIVDPSILERAVSLQLDAMDFFERCDAYHFFDRVGGLIKTGPTNTNVCDLRVGLIAK